MKNYYTNQPNGYLESIQKGLFAVRSFDLRVSHGIGSRDEQIARLKQELETADAIVVGAGAGLSTAAGFTYAGDRFNRYFSDFEEAFGFHDMYTGGFVVMRAAPEVTWAYWARHIYFNRYFPAPKPVYQNLLSLLDGKDYFVITTNVDHQFQRAGFDKKRLFYTQGDYGLFQSVNPKVQETFDNEEWTMRAMEAQGFIRDEGGIFRVPESGSISMKLPAELIPTAPNGDPVTMNLRSDDTFVEDAGWRKASAAYSQRLDTPLIIGSSTRSIGENSREKATSDSAKEWSRDPPRACERSGLSASSENTKRLTATITMLIIMVLMVSRCLLCPNSCASTATISLVVSCSMRVS